ncbi:hypothetical protein HYG87_06600 [Methanobacterium alkalithermotolerans]|uniref:Bacterial Pleckstrin homology domain-containing protein n=1 Tax=Methanobacterium alkalithermotolerans TaxID=2731220 RepID=A0A8T8K6K9_9EURY|nr:PH domain-containing protein [Methanobacterium alkalithermotolerans]QUH23452.1 hypothetical protein HYG87_06600 [Methanobacterium alkalithermotolerans]
MTNEVYKSEISPLFKALNGGLITLFLVIAIFMFLSGEEVRLTVIFLVIIIGLAILFYSGYQIRYELREESLKAKWLFGTKNIEYKKIKDFKAHKIPHTSIRRFGISMLGGRFSNGEIGKFYAIFTSNEGILIETDKSVIYGGKLFISPTDPENFLKQLKKKILENKTAEEI